jgi:hypothetical protein
VARVILVFTLLALFGGCSPQYRYKFLDKEAAKNIPADSLKWNYQQGKLSDLPVMDRHGNVVRLAVDRDTYLYVRTTEKVEHYFEMPSIVVEDHGEGLLGSSTMWRGIDARQHAERSIFIREIEVVEIQSRHPAYSRIQTK